MPILQGLHRMNLPLHCLPLTIFKTEIRAILAKSLFQRLVVIKLHPHLRPTPCSLKRLIHLLLHPSSSCCPHSSHYSYPYHYSRSHPYLRYSDVYSYAHHHYYYSISIFIFPLTLICIHSQTGPHTKLQKQCLCVLKQ